MIHGDPNNLGAELKNRAAIKREGKKDMKPSSVEVLMHDEGPVILYLFPRSNEITRKTSRIRCRGRPIEVHTGLPSGRDGLPGQAGTVTRAVVLE